MGIETAIIGTTALGAAGSIWGASEQRDAASDAARQQSEAANRALDFQEDVYADQRQLFRPYYTAGLQGLYGQNGAMALLGHTGSAGGTPVTSGGGAAPANVFAEYASGSYGALSPMQQREQAAQQNTNQYQAYLDANPDLMAHYSQNNIANSPHLLGGGGRGADLDGNGVISPAEFGQYHYETHGRNEGRALPEVQNAFAQTPAPSGGSGSAGGAIALGNGAYGQTNDQASQILPASDPAPAATTEPTEGPMTQTLRQTPGYQFLLDESRRAIEGSAASRGELLSGAAVNALNERTLGLADQTYQSSVNNNLQLANLGMGSAAQISNAGTNFENAASNAFNQIGNANANASISRANAFNSALNGVTDAAGWGLGSYFGSRLNNPPSVQNTTVGSFNLPQSISGYIS